MKPKFKLEEVLKNRFKTHIHRHPNVSFEEYWTTLSPQLSTLIKMEETGGEPDLYVIDGNWVIIDGTTETPSKRKNLCYDQKARLERKKFPPESSALEMAASMGIQMLDEALYHLLQTYEPHDIKTSSWIQTPEPVRTLGGALFGDTRYGRTFIYHNGADSYYSSRGFRGYIKIK
jgi:hypothetical protein